MKGRKVDSGKGAGLCIFGVLLFFCAFLFNSTLSLAQDEVQEVYKDKNNFFTFSPPAGWTKEEITNDTSSQVNLHSPDGKAGLAVMAQFNEGDANEFFAQKKEYVKNFQQRFPKGKFNLSWDTLGGRKVIKVIFEVPKLVKQEQYFFFDQGVRFDLIYGAETSADLKKYKQVALDTFATVQRQKVDRGK